MYYCDFQVITPWEVETFGTFEAETPSQAKLDAEEWVKNHCYEYKQGEWKWEDFRFPVYTWSEDGLKVLVDLVDNV